MTPERRKKLRRKEFWIDGLTYFLFFVSFSWSRQADEDPLGYAFILLGVYYLFRAVSVLRTGTPRISELFSKDLRELRQWEEKQEGEGYRYAKAGGMVFLVMAVAFFGGAVWAFADRRFGEIPGFKVLFPGAAVILAIELLVERLFSKKVKFTESGGENSDPSSAAKNHK